MVNTKNYRKNKKEFDKILNEILDSEEYLDASMEIWILLLANIIRLKDNYAEKQTLTRVMDLPDITVILKLKK